MFLFSRRYIAVRMDGMDWRLVRSVLRAAGGPGGRCSNHRGRDNPARELLRMLEHKRQSASPLFASSRPEMLMTLPSLSIDEVPRGGHRCMMTIVIKQITGVCGSRAFQIAAAPGSFLTSYSF